MISSLGHRVLPMFLVVLLLPACASPSSTLANDLNQYSQRPLWKSATSPSQLIYLTVKDTSLLSYSYPQGKLVGRIGGLDEAGTICGDASGDIFLTEPDGIFKYAHGGTTPISEISENLGASTCAVDPTSGDLAVLAGANNSVYVYPKQQSPPKIYTDSTFLYTESVTYDSNGNLFVSGASRSDEPTFILAELPKGGSALEPIAAPSLRFDAGIEWDGQYIAVVSAGVREGAGRIDQLAVPGRAPRLFTRRH